ncbi:hypothetical protein EAW55_10620 [Legionella jordanis]|nr:hypothetical protein EAW55_10620 [Legionella jordanis]RMX21539.1 hypothetical protein EAS68_01900 [Legionella jordanis]
MAGQLFATSIKGLLGGIMALIFSALIRVLALLVMVTVPPDVIVNFKKEGEAVSIACAAGTTVTFNSFACSGCEHKKGSGVLSVGLLVLQMIGPPWTPAPI